ncbi:MAG: hypothetical protein C5B57_13300 [Blastocatellia bacterium]|nr:MAG: hypothetical protein C5B57_13300 [Blastocatellia bacterium]
MKRLTFVIGGLAVLPVTVLLHAQGSLTNLTNVQALYASASYEEALAELAKVDTASWNEHVDEYRALCFLALGRTREAEQALEHLVRERPLHSIAGDQYSPRFVSLFETVRRQTVPVVAREVYANARRAYEAGRFDDATGGFRQLAEILSDPTLVEQSPNLADVKELGDGFLKLAEAKRLAAAADPVPSRSSAPAPAVGPVPSTSPAPAPPDPVVVSTTRVFTVADHDVRPPVEIQRRLPLWSPSNGPRPLGEIRGLLEVVTDTEGAIESATLVKSLTPLYDRELLAATKGWKFRPAIKDNEPVKYRWLMEIVLSGR